MSTENLSTTGLMFKAAAIACVAAYVGSAFAATATANMTNTATVSSSCTILATGFTTTYVPSVGPSHAFVEPVCLKRIAAGKMPQRDPIRSDVPSEELQQDI